MGGVPTYMQRKLCEQGLCAQKPRQAERGRLRLLLGTRVDQPPRYMYWEW